MKGTTKLAWQQRDTVLHRSVRVDLLFGPGRDASQAANAVANELANVVASLTPPSFDADAAERAHLDAAEALRRFHLSAATAIQTGKLPVGARLDRDRRLPQS